MFWKENISIPPKIRTTLIERYTHVLNISKCEMFSLKNQFI